MGRITIAVDCDGVLADFSGKIVSEINLYCGSSHTVNDIKEFSIASSLNVSEERIRGIVSRKGFCASIPQYDGAKNFISVLQKYGDVIVCTSPYDSKHWIKERLVWLKSELDIDSNHVMFCPSGFKRLFAADILIEDKLSTCVEWVNARIGDRLSILVDRPWNQSVLGHNRVSRHSTFESIVSEIRSF